MNDLKRIDEYLRDEVPPDEAVVVVRGGPIAAEKLIEHAQRQARAYTYRGEPMFSISVSLTVGGWDLASLLAGPLSSRSTYALSTVGAVRAAGFVFCRPTRLRTTTGSSRPASIVKRNDC